MKRFPETNTILPGHGYVLFVTFMDLGKDEGGFKRFDTMEAALDYSHELSLKQIPWWHKESCPRCKS